MKVTLKTLPEATAQQVFDHVAEHLLTQNSKCIARDNCQYRNTVGKRCAAGCLIADDEYNYEFEGHSWTDLTNWGMVPANHAQLITELQLLHDDCCPEDWSASLHDIALSNNLNDEILFKMGYRKAVSIEDQSN